MPTATDPVVKRQPRRKMTDTDALFQAVEARRLRKQIIVTGIKVASVVTVIPPEDFAKIGIDETYQRRRGTVQVNDLINVLTHGGQIPDPVDISERPDGTLWIVDGQQRFWAHYETKKPMKAHIHRVESRDSEVQLFMALNSRTRLTPKAVLRGWIGPSGEFIRKMNESDKSPLKGMIDLKGDSSKPIDGAALAKCVLTATTGIAAQGDTATTLLPRLDSALRVPGAIAWAEAYVQLLAAVFGPSTGKGGTRVRALPMMALATVAHRKYSTAGRPIFPSSTARLRQVNWDVQVPSHAHKYLGLLIEKIERMWR